MTRHTQQNPCLRRKRDVVWKDIPSAPGYKASSDGKIRGLRVDELRPSLDKDGYETIGVYCGGKGKTVKVHRLVCEAFHGPPPLSKPMVAHLDGNPSNNRPCNLIWADARENSRHAQQHGTHPQGEDSAVAKLSEQQVVEIWLSAYSSRRLARKFGVSLGAITSIRGGKAWKWFTSGLVGPTLWQANTRRKIAIPPDFADAPYRLSGPEAARKYGVSRGTIRRWRRELGVTSCPA